MPHIANQGSNAQQRQVDDNYNGTVEERTVVILKHNERDHPNHDNRNAQTLIYPGNRLH